MDRSSPKIRYTLGIDVPADFFSYDYDSSREVLNILIKNPFFTRKFKDIKLVPMWGWKYKGKCNKLSGEYLVRVTSRKTGVTYDLRGDLFYTLNCSSRKRDREYYGNHFGITTHERRKSIYLENPHLEHNVFLLPHLTHENSELTKSINTERALKTLRDLPIQFLLLLDKFFKSRRMVFTPTNYYKKNQAIYLIPLMNEWLDFFQEFDSVKDFCHCFNQVGYLNGDGTVIQHLGNFSKTYCQWRDIVVPQNEKFVKSYISVGGTK